MKLKLITSLDELSACQSQWDQVAGSRPFFRSQWLLNWLKHEVDSQVTPAVLVAIDETGTDATWQAIAPFCVEARGLIRKIRFLGSGTTCSDYLALIVNQDHPEIEKRFAEAVVDWLADNLHAGGDLGKIDAIDLEGVWLGDEGNQYFFELLTASGYNSNSVELEGCWALQLPQSWDQLNRSLSKSLRRKTKKAVQRLNLPTTEIFSSDDVELDQLWPQFVELHQKRRQMLGQAGCFAVSKFESFLREAMTGLIKSGLGELLVINIAGQPLASFLLLNDGQTVFMYQSGMDPEQLSMEPGYQIAVLAMQRSIEKGFSGFDFLRGDEPYKSRWLTTRVPLVRTRFIPRTFSAQMKHGIWWSGRSIKHYLVKRQ